MDHLFSLLPLIATCSGFVAVGALIASVPPSRGQERDALYRPYPAFFILVVWTAVYESVRDNGYGPGIAITSILIRSGQLAGLVFIVSRALMLPILKRPSPKFQTFVFTLALVISSFVRQEP
ncbi:MAG: hypothetical protein ABIJ86_01850 [Spirochaetota bacterium]